MNIRKAQSFSPGARIVGDSSKYPKPTGHILKTEISLAALHSVDAYRATSASSCTLNLFNQQANLKPRRRSIKAGNAPEMVATRLSKSGRTSHSFAVRVSI